MPATAGRVRMPANNRVHSSAALQTHGIWQSAIGYDPYAPNKEESKTANSLPKSSTNSDPDPENAYASFQGLLALARITGSNADEARGACKRCGRVGHLKFQCRNFLSLKDDKEKDNDAITAAVENGLGQLKARGFRVGGGKNDVESEEESEEEESEDSDTDVDSDIERIIAARQGKRVGSKVKNSSSRKKRVGAVSDDDDDSDSGERKKRGRSKRRRSRKRDSSDSDEGSRKRKREKRRRNESSDEDDERRHRHRKSRKDKRRRRSHRHSDDSDESDKRNKRKSKRADSLSHSDGSNSDDSRVGRGKKRSEKRSRKHHREEA